MIIPLGYLISVISITVLRILFYAVGKLISIKRGNYKHFAEFKNYEAFFNDQICNNAWRILGFPGKANKKKSFYAISTLIHSKIDEGARNWILRRWNSFNLSIHICTALLLSHLCGVFLHIIQDRIWWLISAAIMIIFLCNAIVSYLQTSRMVLFQSELLIIHH